MKNVRVIRVIEYSGTEAQVKEQLEGSLLSGMKSIEVGRMVRATGHHPSGAVACTIRLLNDSWDYGQREGATPAEIAAEQQPLEADPQKAAE